MAQVQEERGRGSLGQASPCGTRNLAQVFLPLNVTQLASWFWVNLGQLITWE